MNVVNSVRSSIRDWMMKSTLEPLTPEEALRLFIKDRIARGRSERTLEDYDRCLPPFVTWCEHQNLQIQQLTRDDIRAYVAELRAKPRPRKGSPWEDSTVAIYIRNLRTFLNWLRAEAKIEHDLAGALDAPNTHVRNEVVMTDQEIHQMLAACEGLTHCATGLCYSRSWIPGCGAQRSRGCDGPRSRWMG